MTPRLIIHGGAGNITPSNLPPREYKKFHHALLSILADAHYYLTNGHDALDTVAFAVSRLEDNGLFNSGHGAVFTREGFNELEASIMVSSGKKKRGVGVMGLRRVKNPIKLAHEILLRGEKDLEGGNGEHRGPMLATSDESFGEFRSRGAQGHSQMHGKGAEKLAKQWGLEIVDQKYFFVQKRWDEHIKGLEREKKGEGLATWDAEEYVSQGTCGAVAMDSLGTCAVATSTGGMTNKLSGRIGDTPTLGAGFWAEQWEEVVKRQGQQFMLSDMLQNIVADCLPGLAGHMSLGSSGESIRAVFSKNSAKIVRATAMSGTGNGDSFLRMNAARTASAIARYRPNTSLEQGIHEITGPGGDLEKSAGNRWKRTGEGEGGIIGIESKIVYDQDGEIESAGGRIIADYNCGGMFRAAINEKGKAVYRVWRPGQHDGLERYEGEGKEYDPREWQGEKEWVGGE